MRVGYIRMSALDQNTARQRDGIDVEKTFVDTASGKDTTRPKLDELLAFVREGDEAIVHSMNRLARNLADLRRLVRIPTGKSVEVTFVKESLTFTGEDSPHGEPAAVGEGSLRRIRARPDPGTPTRRHRRQGPQRLHRSHQRRPPSSALPARPCTTTCTPRAEMTTIGHTVHHRMAVDHRPLSDYASSCFRIRYTYCLQLLPQVLCRGPALRRRPTLTPPFTHLRTTQ